MADLGGIRNGPERSDLYQLSSYLVRYGRDVPTIQGGADSRHEVRAAFSLEELQARHKELLRTRSQMTPALAGLPDGRMPIHRARAGDQKPDVDPPDPPSADRPEEVTGHPDEEAEA